MQQILLLVGRALALAHERWRMTLGQRLSRAARIAVLEERVERLERELAIVRARFLRVPAPNRPRFRPAERLEILWHGARHGLSVVALADAFCVTKQAILNWRHAAEGNEPRLLPSICRLPDLVDEIVQRLKAEWPAWGTRRIAGQLARLGLLASRTSVQRILRRPGRPAPDHGVLPRNHPGLLAKHPNHVWMVDFTRLGGLLRPVWVGAVIDAFSRKVLAIGVVRGAPDAVFACRLLRRAIARHGVPRWFVSDKDPVLRAGAVRDLLCRHGIRRRFGAVGRHGSISLIERTWRSMKQEYARHLFLFETVSRLEASVMRWARWFNAERPHQGLGQRTPDDVYRERPPKRARDLTAGTLSVRFLDGDRRLPILRLHRAA